MTLIPLSEIPDSLVFFNRERYKGEIAQAILELMRKHKVNRKKLAELLGVGKSRISHVLSGDKNLGAETLADILLVLGRTPHLVLATDFDEIRLPIDEGECPKETHYVRRTGTPVPVLYGTFSTGVTQVGRSSVDRSYTDAHSTGWATTRMGGRNENVSEAGTPVGDVEVFCVGRSG